MKLSDCTKAELLWVIQRAKEHSLGALEHAGGGAELQMVLTDEKRALLGDHEAAKL